MSVRSLIAVYAGGRHRVAQYAQLGGEPGGQGRLVLEFCRTRLSTPQGRTVFAGLLDRTRFITDSEAAAVRADLVPEHRGPLVGAAILEELWCRAEAEEMVLHDALPFAESVLCEWAYVVDLDAGVLELYRGLNTTALDPDVDRFALREPGVCPRALNAASAMGRRDHQPVRIVAAWSLDDLPELDELVAAGEAARGRG